MNEPHYDNAIDMMDRLGGSFAKAIAHAYYCADSGNKAKLMFAFADLFAKYERMYKQYTEQDHE
jgi:hypothetical protein